MAVPSDITQREFDGQEQIELPSLDVAPVGQATQSPVPCEDLYVPGGQAEHAAPSVVNPALHTQPARVQDVPGSSQVA